MPANRPKLQKLRRLLAGLYACLEAAGEYYYEEVNVKRWVLGSGGRSGNCETCVENADMGWIPDDDVFLASDGGDLDGPPAHPNCDCTLEYSEKRKRVYV